MVSIKKSALVLGLVAMTGAGVGAGLDASAATSQNINTPGTACNPFNAAEAGDIDYLTTGVRTIASGPRKVICPVTRHPVTGPGQTVWVDGSNSPGKTTTCAAYVTTFYGQFVTAYSFSSSASTYDAPAPLNPVGTFDYVSVLCDLPAQGGGVVFGVIADDN